MPPPFLAHLCSSSLPTSQNVPPKLQNDPKTSPHPSQNASQKFKLGAHRSTLHCHSSFLLLDCLVLLIKYYFLSTQFLSSLSTMLYYATSSHIVLRMRCLDVSVAVVSFVVVVSFLACFCTSPHNNAFIFTKKNIGNATYK